MIYIESLQGVGLYFVLHITCMYVPLNYRYSWFAINFSRYTDNVTQPGANNGNDKIFFCYIPPT